MIKLYMNKYSENRSHIRQSDCDEDSEMKIEEDGTIEAAM